MAELAREINKAEIVKSRSERNKIFSLGQRKRLLECHCKPIHFEEGEIIRSWADIEPIYREDTKGILTVDRNKVATVSRIDKNMSSLLKFEDRQNNFISYSLIGIKANEISLSGVSETSKFLSTEQTALNESKLLLADNFSVESYINEMGGKLWFVFPEMVSSFDIKLLVTLGGKLVCLNPLGKDGFYIKDARGRFNFGTLGAKEPVFWIKPPYWRDSEEGVYHDIDHSLANVGGQLIYSKFSTESFTKRSAKTIAPIKIDVNTYYSESDDGWIVSDDDWERTWDKAHDNTSSSCNPDTNDSYYAYATMAAKDGGYYNVIRSFFRFDTSSLPDVCTITDADQYLYGVTNYDSSVCAQQGTQGDTMGADDFDAFTGSEFGHTSWAIGDRTITFNSTGKAAISKTGYTYICCREYEHDYLDVEPSTEYANGFGYSENAGTTYDPKLNVTYTLGSPPNVNQPMWF